MPNDFKTDVLLSIECHPWRGYLVSMYVYLICQRCWFFVRNA